MIEIKLFFQMFQQFELLFLMLYVYYDIYLFHQLTFLKIQESKNAGQTFFSHEKKINELII